MALPAAYTEATFKAYLHALLNMGGFAGDLGWSVVGGQYDEIVNEALLTFGNSDITTITGSSDLNKIRIAGRVALWGVVASATAHLRDSRTASGTQSSLSQVYDHAIRELQRANDAAANVGLSSAAMTIGITTIRATNDPYRFLTDSEISELDS